MLTKQEIFLGKGTLVESSRVREPRRTALPHGLPHGSGFMVMGLVSWLSLANHSDSKSFLVVHASLSQDRCQRDGFWEVVRQVVSPFDLSRTLLVGGGLLVPCPSPGPPVVSSSCRCLLWGLARAGGISQRASPNKATPSLWQLPHLHPSLLGSLLHPLSIPTKSTLRGGQGLALLFPQGTPSTPLLCQPHSRASRSICCLIERKGLCTHAGQATPSPPEISCISQVL